MSWTEERVATLTKLWADGLSASQIAAELGGVTRNAVIGKVHRLGLSGRAKTSSSTRAKRAPKPAQARAPKPSIARAPGLPTPRTAATIARSAPEIDLVMPKSLELRLEALTEETCKWPAGDPATNEFSFCGAPSKEDCPYCEYHAKLAYQPMSDRRRDRRQAGA